MSTFTEHTFPYKLYACLLDLEAQGLSHIASFQPHGRCFLVHQPHVLVKQILAKWFRQTKYASFQRQLNIYGFRRISSGTNVTSALPVKSPLDSDTLLLVHDAVGPDKNAYYHPSFLQGRPDLLDRIRCISVKGTGPRKAGSIDDQPNFYTLPPLEYTMAASASDEMYRGQRVEVTNDVLPSRVAPFQHLGVGTEHGVLNPIPPTPMATTAQVHPFAPHDLAYSLNVPRVLPVMGRATLLDTLATSNAWNATHAIPEPGLETTRRLPLSTPHWASLAAVHAAHPSPTTLDLLRVVQERQELQARQSARHGLDTLATSNAWNATHAIPEPGLETTRRLPLSTHHMDPPHWGSLAAVQAVPPSPTTLALLRVVQERQELQAQLPGSRLPLSTHSSDQPHWASLAAVPVAHPGPAALALLRVVQERQRHAPQSTRHELDALATSNAWNSMRVIPEPGSETTRRLPLWTDHANPPHWASLAAVPAAHPSSTTLALVRAAQERRPQDPLGARPNVAALWAAFRRYE